MSESADKGSEAVNATINGIAIIRDQTLKAKRALEGLASRIGEIGEIATVIGGISDETNLLSLNAAIIAAQAGEHGKAFAVVAGPGEDPLPAHQYERQADRGDDPLGAGGDRPTPCRPWARGSRASRKASSAPAWRAKRSR